MRLIILSLLTIIISSCRPRFEREITTGEIGEHINYLASEALKGRYPGTPEDSLLLEYIARELDHAGLIMHGKTGLQSFEIITEIGMGPGNWFSWDEGSFALSGDYTPVSFSASGGARAGIVFAGFGFRIREDGLRWDDYAGMDVRDRWVMILRGVPVSREGASPYINYSEDRAKALQAADMGAAGVILVSGPGHDEEDSLDELKGKQHPLPIPVVQLRRPAADQLLAAAGHDNIATLEAILAEKAGPASFKTGVTAQISVDLQPRKVHTANIIGILRGSDPGRRSEYVIVGAHHDHLGMGGPGSSSRRPDTVAVHYGADDNASGVAAVLEISEDLVTRSPSRSILFTTFGAEEQGLVGSRYLVENEPVDLSSVQVMINLDMVGRLNEERQLQVGGIGTSPGLRALLDSVNLAYGLNLKYSSEGYGPSDHAAFYSRDIPVLFFSTGAHTDYHTPADRPRSVNLEGAREVMMFVADVIETLANENEKLAFTEAGPKVGGSSRGRSGKITLGLMPDVTYDGSRGMPVMFVTEGKPASVGGVQKGDTITAIEGKTVGNVYDYMNRLNRLKEGMDIVVTVRRGDDELDLVVRL